jgi:quinol monooxygenase YgiN
MLFELRQYRVRPGRRDEWVKVMEEVIIPFQASKGIVIVGSFVAEEDPDLYVWIRRFDDEQDRQQRYAAVYESDYWKNEVAPRTTDLLEREKMVITRLLPTPKSVLR